MNDTKTVSGAIVHITDADEAPLVKCLVDITPKQSGTGTPSPSNVRAISGWESVSVNVTGVNRFPFLNARTTTFKGVTITCDGEGTSTMSGTATGNDYASLAFPSTFTIPDSAMYKFCMLNTEAHTSSVFRFVNGSTIVDSWAPNPINREANYVGMSGKEVTGVRMYITSGETYNMTLQPMFVPKTETVTGYIPYNGHTTTTSLGRTVYGGTLDVVTGVLTVTHRFITLDGSSVYSTSAGVASGSIILTHPIAQAAPTKTDADILGITSDYLPEVTSYSSWRTASPSITTNNAGNSIWLRLPDVDTQEKGVTYMTNHPLQICYPLATPQTYTLTGQEISAMYGENYIWASSGPVEITYRTNVLGIYNKIYIDGRPYFRPNDFEIRREDVYAGEYTSCTGRILADKIGWKFSDLTMKWDILPDADLAYLTSLSGPFTLKFRDNDGAHTETVIRRGFTNTPTRITGPEGSKIWTGVEMEVTFINVHNT